MEINEEQLNKIYELITNGVLTRNVILDELTKNDELLKNILDLKRQGKDEIVIAEMLKTSIAKVRESVDLIEQLSKKIDSILSEKYNRDYESKKSEKQKKEEQRMQIRTKKALYQNQMKEFLIKYREAKDSGKLSKMNLEENARKFEAKLNYVGDRVSYRLYLAEMYLYTGKIKKVREILSSYELDTLTDMEMKQYKNIEQEIIVQENKAIIRKLCDRGLDYQGILNECEKVSTGNRVYLKPKVVKEYMTEYYNLKNKDDKER